MNRTLLASLAALLIATAPVCASNDTTIQNISKGQLTQYLSKEARATSLSTVGPLMMLTGFAGVIFSIKADYDICDYYHGLCDNKRCKFLDIASVNLFRSQKLMLSNFALTSLVCSLFGIACLFRGSQISNDAITALMTDKEPNTQIYQQ